MQGNADGELPAYECVSFLAKMVELAQVLVDLLHETHSLLTFVGEGDAVVVAQEERTIELFFKVFDGDADGRCRDEEILCSLGDGATLVDGEEIMDLVEVHGVHSFSVLFQTNLYKPL